MKVLRLTFLELGPRVDCLDLFENLDTLYLQNNMFNELTQTTFQFNLRLRDLNLSHNKFIKLNGALSHLIYLNFLDISFNSIEDLDVYKEFPPNIHVLRCTSNPFLRKPTPTGENGKEYFRKQVILALPDLAELDKTQVLPMERLKYQGKLPVHLHAQVDRRLAEIAREQKERETRERVELELEREIQRDQGIDEIQATKKTID